MAYSQRESMKALQALPRCIEVELYRGEHRGKTQLYAEYDQGGNPYTLVVADAVMVALKPRAGQKWLAHPSYTPNGYIVFCDLTAPEKETEKRVAQATSLGFVRPQEASWEDINARIQELAGDGLMGVEEQCEFYEVGIQFNRKPASA